MCTHAELAFGAGHSIFAAIGVHYLEITGHCTACGKILLFRGVPDGFSALHPTMSEARDELRVPFVFQGETDADEVIAGDNLNLNAGRAFEHQ